MISGPSFGRNFWHLISSSIQLCHSSELENDRAKRKVTWLVKLVNEMIKPVLYMVMNVRYGVPTKSHTIK